MLKKIWNKFDKKILVIFLISLIMFSSNLFGGYYYGHDTPFHVSNLLGWINNFKVFDISSTKIVSLVAHNFGYGTGIFYPPLGHYLVLYIYKIVSFWKFGIFLAIKLSYLVSMFLSGLFMYLLVKKTFKNDWAALLSAIFYITFPYHILDIFTRDAMSESYLFIFVPLVFLGIEYLFEKNYKKFYVFFVIGYVGSLFSHLVLTVYLTIFVMLFLILNFKKVWIKKNILSFIIASLLILIFSSPYIFPLLEHKLYGEYMVFAPGHMYNINSILGEVLTLQRLLSVPQHGAYIYYTISIVSLFCLIVLCTCGFSKIKNKASFINYFILFFVCLFFVSRFFPWRYVPKMLLNIQFPWRLELFLAFFMSLLSSLIVVMVKRDNQKVLVTILICISTFFGVYCVNVHDYGTIDIKNLDVSFLGQGWGQEYLPVKTFNHLKYFDSRNDNVIVKSGDAEITNTINETPNMSFDVKTDNCVLELPRLYYLGYDIRINGKYIKYSENKYGFIQINLTQNGKVTVIYSGTLGYKISIVVAFVTVIGCIIYLYFNRSKKEAK